MTETVAFMIYLAALPIVCWWMSPERKELKAGRRITTRKRR